ncbi:hypothetical protein GCM10027176_58630 [Actinoallomurus bryophytorum]
MLRSLVAVLCRYPSFQAGDVPALVEVPDEWPECAAELEHRYVRCAPWSTGRRRRVRLPLRLRVVLSREYVSCGGRRSNARRRDRPTGPRGAGGYVMVFQQ